MNSRFSFPSEFSGLHLSGPANETGCDPAADLQVAIEKPCCYFSQVRLKFYEFEGIVSTRLKCCVLGR